MRLFAEEVWILFCVPLQKQNEKMGKYLLIIEKVGICLCICK